MKSSPFQQIFRGSRLFRFDDDRRGFRKRRQKNRSRAAKLQNESGSARLSKVPPDNLMNAGEKTPIRYRAVCFAAAISDYF